MASTTDTPVETLALDITVDFSGGLEMLFSDQKRHSLSIPAIDNHGQPSTIAFLIDYLCKNTMKDPRAELFVLDEHIRPGILVLINDADWELEGEETYEIQAGDNILFVSTLHGARYYLLGFTPTYPEGKEVASGGIQTTVQDTAQA
ncbi:hypothetical protein B0T19DRAFT_484760 [Cercophora scortea]|uniref:Ubiquitin-related modifier 1 n=1 Tax=Cercophora scortea TaxID=314031 RepID=A0AAE0IMU8_9PEZI|nr:hypothetical protein B0T19DRAFT_484760 [Cercophora scortea]